MKMNKHLIVLGIAILLLCVGLSGCEELEALDKPDYITVTVYMRASVYVMGDYSDIDEEEIEDPDSYDDDRHYLEDMFVRFEVYKDGALKADELLKTSTAGLTPSFTTTVKLYKEQNVVVKGWLSSDIPLYYEDMSWIIFDKDELTWDEVRSTHDFGDIYWWDPLLDFHGYY